MIRCLCGRTMQPVIFTQGKGWTCFYVCFKHPGPYKPSTESYPLPDSLAPANIRLDSYSRKVPVLTREGDTHGTSTTCA